MLVLRFGGKPRDYAILAVLVALEGAIALSLAPALAPSAGAELAHRTAYIDPGVGAMIVQAIAAAFFGAMFYFKNLRKALARMFLKMIGREPAPERVEAAAPEKK